MKGQVVLGTLDPHPKGGAGCEHPRPKLALGKSMRLLLKNRLKQKDWSQA
jgi:hypothetical protein